MPFEFVASEKITLDYLNSAEALKQVFRKHFRKPSMRRFKVDREKIVDKLLSYNRRLNAPEPAIRNIESLSQSDTYAIVTGQQPGIFTGPLYTVYKAISAIVLCEIMSDEKQSFVPVFWNASEDDDFSEVDHIVIFRKNEPLGIRYDREMGGEAFSHMRVDKSELKKILSIVEDVSPNSEFKKPLLKEISMIIQESSTLGDFFSRLMIHLFGESGLVMIEPQPLRDLMAPIFNRLISRPTECTQILTEAGHKLKKLGYPPKIRKKPDICNFFIFDDEGRRLRVTYNGNFQAANETYSQRELLRLLEDDPYRFSANAVTRPITQDFLLPTFAYVAGPNEIAYQAQLKGVYYFFSLERPVIYPRYGGTVVEKKVSRVLTKYKAQIQELRNPEKLLKRIPKDRVDDVFSSFKSEVQEGMVEVTRRAESIDQTLKEPCFLARGKILKTIEGLEDKVASKLKKKDSIARQQITKASRNLFPNGDLQERQINVLEYLIKFGKEFLKKVHQDFLEANYGEHRVIEC
ncbi:MAG: bacillithiol biosynthesis cysteine-adding enzyme BshC [Candidatus Bathyarchaeota archaeon]|nr:MAG: bacillithiol biosynthesis cysteine-adding enzyme BshC [Candidatus Bathyarchaeota archaeon]